MKANEPKRKIFSDAVDLLGGGDVATAAVGSVVEMLDINAIRPFRDHPFRLYEGERLEDMVESIKEHGILNPVIVRKMHYGYEMLSGHNRQNAGKIAGLKEIPAIVKDNLPDSEAYVYVIETNLMQRSFSDLQISEKAAVLAERYDKVISQGKRFVRYKEGAELYSMCQSKFEDMARDAGAIYKLNKLVLVNCDIFEEYLETFHVKE